MGSRTRACAKPRCPACGSQNVQGSSFCSTCGSPVDGPPGERKLASVLFADLSGFTALAEQLDPERVSDVVSECLHRLSGHAMKHGGLIEHYEGDCLMALFGVPSAHEDDPHRACRASLAMIEDVREYNLERAGDLPCALGVHAGIATGIVVAGTSLARGARSLTAFGDTVNTANRLCSSARSGQVLVCSRTYSHARGAFRFGGRMHVVAKGKSEPVTTWPILGHSVLPRTRGFAGLRAPLVGRREELKRLRSAWADVRSGRGRVVLVVGDAGIGKTRLVGEFTREVARGGGEVYRGSCEPLSRERMLAPIAELVREILCIDRETPPDRIDAAVRRATSGCLRVVSGVIGRLLRGQGDEPDAPRSDKRRAQEVESALVRLLESRAARRPLCLVLDDLHWSDEMSLRLLGSVAPQVARLRVLLLCVARPELERPWSAEVEEIRLDGLAPSDGRRMLSSLLRLRHPREIEPVVLDRADGNPFFVEELVRSLIDEGTIERKGRGWELVDSPDDLRMPASLHSLVASRIDALDPITKGHLQWASVLGRTFSVRILSSVSEHAVRLGDDLDLLARMELIRRPSGDHDEWAFKHDVTREVAYESILMKHRKALHRRVAEVIERRFPKLAESDPEAMAEHYTRAEDWERALPYLSKSAERAMHHENNRVALERFELAVNLLDSMGESPAMAALRGRLLAKRGRVLHRLGRIAEAAEVLEEAIRWCRKRKLSSEWALACVEKSYVHIACAEYDKAVQVLRKARRLYRRAGDSTSVADTLRVEAITMWSTGKHRAATTANARALALYRTAKDMKGQAQVLNNLGLLAHSCGDYSKALSLYRESLAIRKRLGEPDSLALVSNNMGRTHRELGDLRSAIKYHRVAVEIWSMLGWEVQEATAHNALARTLMDAGDFDSSMRELETAFEIRRRLGLESEMTATNHHLGHLFMFKGEFDKALGYYEAARVGYESRGERHPLATIYVSIGWLYADVSDWRGAVEAFDNARKLAVEVGAERLAQDSGPSLLRMYVAMGDLRRASSEAEEIVRWARSSGQMTLRGEADVAAGVLLAARGKYSSAAGRFRRAERLFARLGFRVRQAEALVSWGRVMCICGRREEGLRRFAQAARLYSGLGAPKRVEMIEKEIKKYSADMKTV